MVPSTGTRKAALALPVTPRGPWLGSTIVLVAVVVVGAVPVGIALLALRFATLDWRLRRHGSAIRARGGASDGPWTSHGGQSSTRVGGRARYGRPPIAGQERPVAVRR